MTIFLADGAVVAFRDEMTFGVAVTAFLVGMLFFAARSLISCRTVLC
jgi:hypothetical protein